MNEMIILNHNEEYLDIITVCECIECSRDRKINGYNTLDFSLHVNHQVSNHVVKNNRILFRVDDEDRWYEYIIAGIVKNDGIISVHCESSLYSTLSNYIEFVDITGNTVTNGLAKILNSCTPESDWNTGRSDISGSFYMQRSKRHLKEVLFSWAEEVGGQIDERIEFYDGKIVRYIDIIQRLGTDRGKVLFDDREISNCSIKEPDGYVYTCAYGYGASTGIDENGNAIFTTFEDIVWSKSAGDPVDKPRGQKYISLELNDDQLRLYGLKVNDKFKHRTTVVEFNDVSDSTNLLKRTYQSLLDNIADKTEYTINSKDMKALGYDVEEVRLGDTIGIVIEKLGKIKLRADVIRYKEDYKNPSNNIFELNNYSNNYVSQQLNYQQAVSEIQNKVQGIIHQTFFKTVLERWNEEINSDGSYLVQGNPLDGLIAYNAETKAKATKATRLKGGSLQISNKKVNGEFEWTTVLTGDGMIADVIIAGILKGNMFDIDLDSGIVRFGKRDSNGNIMDPLLLLDEDGLKIKHISQIENDVSKIMKNFTVYLETNRLANQVYDSNAQIYIPDFFTNNLVVTAHAYDLEGNELSDAKYEWKRKTENGLEPLVAGEHINGNVLTISHNFDESVTFVCTATLDLISKKEELTVISTKTGKDGQDGRVGPQGPQGVQGPKGENGKNSYFHVKYSRNASGNPMSDSAVDAVYIGVAVTENSTAPANYTSYSWSKIKGEVGPQGEAGTIGPKGSDGKTSYLHIKYSDNGTTFTSNNGETPGKYIGTYVDFTEADSSVFNDYTWVKVEGPQGVKGPKGENGKQYYTWLKYADSPTSGMSDNPAGKAYIGLAYNKEASTESSNYSDYTWSLIKGEKGDQGVAGGKGADGKTFYTWIKYATSSSGANMSDDPTGKTYIGLAYNKTTTTESTNADDYTWSLIKGDKGDNGKGIKSVTNYYLATASSSGITASTSGWTTSVQSVSSSKKYLWNYEVITYTDNSTTASAPCIIGAYGDTGPIGASGATGVGISAITEYYQVSTSNTAAPTSWVTVPPSMTETNKYLWNYEVIKYTNNTTKETAKRVIGVYGNKGNTGATGPQGPAGKGIKSTAITYQAGTSGTTAPTGTWSATIPTVAQGQYLWSKTVITYTDNTTSTTYSVAYIPKNGTNGINGTNGATGATGTGVNTIVQQYYLSTSKTAQSGGSWVTAMPMWSTGMYLWTRFQINYKNPASTVYTTPVCDSSWEAVNNLEADVNERFDEAANDLATQLSNAKAEFSSEIVKTADTIKQEVSASYYSKDDGELLAKRTTELEQDSQSWTFNFETLTKQLAGLDKEQKENYARILKYIRFENGNIILGESGNSLTLTIQNDKIVFKQSDKELAYFTNGKLYVTNGEFTQSLRIGNYSFVPRSNGSLDFKKVG